MNLPRLYNIAKENLFDSSLVLMSWLVPKGRDRYVFSASTGKTYSGNPKFLFEYMRTKHRCVFVVNDKPLVMNLRQRGIKANYTYSFASWWSVVRARSLVVDNGLRGPFAYGILARFGRFNILQTWHGTGIKGTIKHHGMNETIRKWLNKSFSTILASSPPHKEVLQQYFENDNVVITGSPKNDIFFRKSLPSGYSYLDKYDSVILYAPTFRDDMWFHPFDSAFLNRLNEWLKENNYIFLIKRHPNDPYFVVGAGYENIRDITKEVEDVQELLLFVDILITDYSSISTDFSLTGRPIIFYVYDNEEYTKIRPHFFGLERLPGPFVYDQDSLLDHLKDMSWSKSLGYKMDYMKSRDFWNTYQDGKSCKRVEALLDKRSVRKMNDVKCPICGSANVRTKRRLIKHWCRDCCNWFVQGD